MDQTTLHYRIGQSLMRQPEVQTLVDQSYRRIHARYRAEWGGLDFLALKLLARTALRLS